MPRILGTTLFLTYPQDPGDHAIMMKIYIPNSAFLGNIDAFLKSMDTHNPEILEIEGHPLKVAMNLFKRSFPLYRIIGKTVFEGPQNKGFNTSITPSIGAFSSIL